MPSLRMIENAIGKYMKKKQEVEGGTKQVYEFVEAQEEVQKGKSIVISNRGNSDKSVTMKEENIYPATQLEDDSNLKSLSCSPAECALLPHQQ